MKNQALNILPEIQAVLTRNNPLFLGFICLFIPPLALQTFSFGAEPTVEVLVGPSSPSPDENAASDLRTPFAIEFAAGGEMIIVELDGGRIFSWHFKNGLRQLAGAGNAGYLDGDAMEAKFNQLHNLAIRDDGSMLLSDHNNHAIRKYDPSSRTVSTVLGNGKRGIAIASVIESDAQFNLPIAVSLAPDKKSLLIADIGNRCIRRWDMQNGKVTIVAGNGMSGVPQDGTKATESPLVDPRAAIENEAGEIFILERGGNALRVVDTHGNLSTIAGTGKPGAEDGKALKAQLNGPKHLCFAPDAAIFIADDNNHAIRRYDSQSKTLTTVDLGKYTLRRPHGVCVHDGWLYIADSYQHRILRVKL